MDIIFGYSRLGKSMCDYLLSIGKKDIVFCDNSSKKIGEEYRNIPVISVSKAIHGGGISMLLACFIMTALRNKFLAKA